MRLYIVCFIVNLVACRNNTDETSKVRSAEVPDDVFDVETKLNLKGNVRKLFAVELGLNSEGQNMICSPISAMMPLAKLLLGAEKRSESKAELLAALGLRNSKEISRKYKQILNELEYLDGVQIILASRTYLSDKYQLQEKFKNKSISIFKSAVELVDTSRSEEVADRINQWVADHTNDKIKNLISENDIAESASLLLVNAIYFKILELPYRGEEAAMIIVLPNDKNGLPILLRTLRLSQDLLTKALQEMVTVTVDVIIPKFRIDTALDLKSYYEKASVRFKNNKEIVFECEMAINSSLRFERSGLTKIVKHHTVYISSATQRAIVEVTEKGTVATAASVIIGFGSPMPSSNKIEFNAEHPFLFYIRGHHEQLFAGVVISP
ncbi:unnamed protein product [Arctia plantaginis]|uniref:Serpin domain-containing protein n=1 Tax=Arctia plantaginis TaxID=874455 RepID=A0A8S1AH92_ARCPL|nr:unnamed protein product [Arctia plantaginis]